MGRDSDSEATGQSSPKATEHYRGIYGKFVTSLWSGIRSSIYGEDFGHNGWSAVHEFDQLIERLRLTPGSLVLDVACGSGGPSLRIASNAGCRVVGVDVHPDGIAAAKSQASSLKLTHLVEFHCLDASKSLPFEANSFDCLICIDAINHFPDRLAVLADWERVLKPGGRFLFTDPVIITGPISSEEIAMRSSAGFFLFAPPREHEQLIERAGLRLLASEDLTESMASSAGKWVEALNARFGALAEVEGEEKLKTQIDFFETAHVLATERRLSRFSFSGEKPV